MAKRPTSNATLGHRGQKHLIAAKADIERAMIEADADLAAALALIRRAEGTLSLARTAFKVLFNLKFPGVEVPAEKTY